MEQTKLNQCERISKLEILSKATDYCQYLTKKGESVNKELDSERSQNKRLKNILREIKLEIVKTIGISV